eukprot:m.364901 g.364901  ORF g.364901 m.364901 type:complete len:274 (+) comp28965_c0_seq1:1596-2417(+)
MHPRNYLNQQGIHSYCLGIGVSSSPSIVLGAVALQGLAVEFDRENTRLGLRPLTRPYGVLTQEALSTCGTQLLIRDDSIDFVAEEVSVKASARTEQPLAAMESTLCPQLLRSAANGERSSVARMCMATTTACDWLTGTLLSHCHNPRVRMFQDGQDVIFTGLPKCWKRSFLSLPKIYNVHSPQYSWSSFELLCDGEPYSKWNLGGVLLDVTRAAAYHGWLIWTIVVLFVVLWVLVATLLKVRATQFNKQPRNIMAQADCPDRSDRNDIALKLV